MALPLRAGVEKTVYGVETHADFPVKKKFWIQLSVKKVIQTVFWDMKENSSELISLKKVKL